MSITQPHELAEPGVDATRVLGELRAKLDNIDCSLLGTLRDRLECCIDIANLKRQHAIPMMQPHRIGLVQRRAERFAAENGIDAAFLHRLYELIIDETCRIETLVIAEGRRSDEHRLVASATTARG